MPSTPLQILPESALVARANALCNEACSLQNRGEFARGAALLEQAEHLCELAGVPPVPWGPVSRLKRPRRVIREVVHGTEGVSGGVPSAGA